MRGPLLTRTGETGFSLLEALISITFLTIVAVTLLQSMAYCFRVAEEARRSWRDCLTKWNEVQELRSLHRIEGDPIVVVPLSKPMTHHEITVGNQDAKKWGVLRAAK
jgi:Tfp pilus assembly protein PilV